ncbi:MAG TPA: BON domain-containing protein [Polyangiaceae bacterium]|nr:BON domain-containing protein [Polyangiaceae bacterium]
MDAKLIVYAALAALGCSHRGDTPESESAPRTTPTTVVATRANEQYVFESPPDAPTKQKRLPNESTASKRERAPEVGEARAKSNFVEPGTHLDDSGNTVTIPPADMTDEAAPSADSSEAQPTAFDQGESERDRTITSQIRRALMGESSLSFAAKNVAVVTKDGNVTLRGTVKTAAERSTVDNFARRIAGERAVENRIEVTP